MPDNSANPPHWSFAPRYDTDTGYWYVNYYWEDEAGITRRDTLCDCLEEREAFKMVQLFTRAFARRESDPFTLAEFPKGEYENANQDKDH